MKSHVKALVVGGGAVGTSIAYHLAKAGWQDVMLLERDELTLAHMACSWTSSIVQYVLCNHTYP